MITYYKIGTDTFIKVMPADILWVDLKGEIQIMNDKMQEWMLGQISENELYLPSTEAEFHNAFYSVRSKQDFLMSTGVVLSPVFNVGEGAESEEELNNN